MFQIPDTELEPQKCQSPVPIAKQWRQRKVAFFGDPFPKVYHCHYFVDHHSLHHKFMALDNDGQWDDSSMTISIKMLRRHK